MHTTTILALQLLLLASPALGAGADMTVKRVGPYYLIEWQIIVDHNQHKSFLRDLPCLVDVPVGARAITDSRGFVDVRTATLPKRAYDPRLDSLPEHQDIGRYDAIPSTGRPFPRFPWES